MTEDQKKDVRIDSLLKTICAQRNSAQDQVAELVAQVELLTQELKEVKDELEKDKPSKSTTPKSK